MIHRLRKHELVLDVIYDIAGGLLFALGVHCFIAPNHVAPGGVTGLSVIVNYLSGFPIGTMSFIINIPLFIMGHKFLGGKFTVKTFKSVAILTLMQDGVVARLPVYVGDQLIAAAFGGALMGAGLAVVFMRGSTSGGTDILSRLIQLKLPYLPIGRLLLLIDVVILVFAAVVFRNIESFLYGMICIFTSSQVLDRVLYGMDSGRMCLIISCKEEEIATQLQSRLNRGVTYLMGQGAYTGASKRIILCAVRTQQFYRVKELVSGIDPEAFIIITEAGEILGPGFGAIHRNK